MIYLEDIAQSKDLPGILIQHALLKADLQLSQGRDSDARNTLIKALDIYNSPGVKSLLNQVHERIREIGTKTKTQEGSDIEQSINSETNSHLRNNK